MRMLILSLLILAALGVPSPAAASPDEDLAACSTRHAELTRQAAGFSGDARIKRLIDADLKRALKEQAEGDGEECMEALGHATKLLAGDV